jgi:hypothetical protein
LGWRLPWLDGIVRHPNPEDSYWKPLDVSDKLSGMQLAAQHTTGYYDLFARDVVQSFHSMRRNPSNQTNQRLILGPWSHQTLGKRRVGELDFGPDAEVDLRKLDREWFDLHLKGTGGRAGALVRYFSLGDNTWHNASDWPPDEASVTPLYVRSNGLSWNAPGRAERPDVFLSDPLHPTPDHSPNMAAPSRVEPILPIDYSRAEGRSDVRAYVGPPLKAPLRYAGPIVMEIWGTADTASVDWFVRLLQVRADGRAIGLAMGILRAPVSKTTGPYRVDLGHSAATIPAGDSLRVEIAGSWFPTFDRNLHIEEHTSGAKPRTARQVIFHSTQSPSRLLLPVLNRSNFRP